MKETKYWTGHIFAGAALLFLLGFHFLYTHIGSLLFGVEDNITEKISQGRDARTGFLVFFVVLLGLGLYHGLYGLKNIIFELVSCRNCQRIISALLVIMGLFLFAFGSYSSFLAHQKASEKISAPNPGGKLHFNQGGSDGK
jgi:succinate dehydrogenase hydrophobic anchor subunit